MVDTGAGTQFTVLGPGGALDDSSLVEHYAYPTELNRCWVRANMVTSIDGGASADGKSGGLGGSGDRAVFTLMRGAADVVMVGAGTVRTENYSGVQSDVAQRHARRQRGQAEVPPIAIVTNSGHLDRDSLVLTRTEVPPLILTSTRSFVDTRERLGSAAEVIDASGSDEAEVDPAVALSALAERNLFRVLAEGGPSLLGTLIDRDLIDELCLTVAPLLVGGEAPRIATGPGHSLTRLRRSHLLADDEGYLYTRYVRDR
jgi:riboflavin biosynthesis pyrimidine reductase